MVIIFLTTTSQCTRNPLVQPGFTRVHVAENGRVVLSANPKCRERTCTEQPPMVTNLFNEINNSKFTLIKNLDRSLLASVSVWKKSWKPATKDSLMAPRRVIPEAKKTLNATEDP